MEACEDTAICCHMLPYYAPYSQSARLKFQKREDRSEDRGGEDLQER